MTDSNEIPATIDSPHNGNIPLYAVPGTMCDERLWQQLNLYLDARLSLKHIAIDSAENLEHMGQLVAENFQTPGCLLGFSLGGYVALNYAIEYPHKVDKLVIVGSSALGLAVEEQQRRQQRLSLLGTPNSQFRGLSNKQWLDFIGENPKQKNEIIQTMRDMEQSLGVEVFLTQMHETTSRPSLLEQLSQIRCPVLLIAGQQDKIVAQADLEKMAQQIEQSKLVVLPNCGHMVPLEQPKRLAKLINDFTN